MDYSGEHQESKKVLLLFGFSILGHLFVLLAPPWDYLSICPFPQDQPKYHVKLRNSQIVHVPVTKAHEGLRLRIIRLPLIYIQLIVVQDTTLC